MLRGEAWEHLQLLDSNGKVIDLAFLEIDQELWDRDQRRLTVLFDPGRIKRGVLPRDEIGAALEAGKSYTLHMYEGVQHAFHNDTAGARYDPAAARLAWSRTIEFFGGTLR